MSRGGVREGAGRKPVLTPMQMIAVGGECERRFRQEWERARQTAWDEKPAVKEVHALQAEVRAGVKEHGPAFWHSAEGRELRETVEQAIREIRRTPDFVEHTNRVFTLTAPRPKGVKANICKAVAAEFSQEWGVSLSPRNVQTCWDQFRAFEEDTRPD